MNAFLLESLDKLIILKIFIIKIQDYDINVLIIIGKIKYNSI